MECIQNRRVNSAASLKAGFSKRGTALGSSVSNQVPVLAPMYWSLVAAMAMSIAWGPPGPAPLRLQMPKSGLPSLLRSFPCQYSTYSANSSQVRGSFRPASFSYRSRRSSRRRMFTKSKSKGMVSCLPWNVPIFRTYGRMSVHSSWGVTLMRGLRSSTYSAKVLTDVAMVMYESYTPEPSASSRAPSPTSNRGRNAPGPCAT
mmetsp:Transcript_35731/g.65786  ORF Transcript_35731/g.65786 Transcript_35731/m.65786 type:complete len:202 (-) Transcript_35731:655-1260(-)